MKSLALPDQLNLDTNTRQQVAGVLQTLLGTAQLNRLDPAAWLTEALIKLPTWPYHRIDELLPFTPEFTQPLSQ